MNEQYGGQDEPSAGFGSTYRAANKFSNAYMLVYIREQDWNTIMCDVSVFKTYAESSQSLSPSARETLACVVPAA